MFLINPIEKLIYYYDNNLKKIEWNFDIVKKSIENKVQKFKSYENYFINTNLCTDDFIIDRDTIIIDFHRKKEFKITSEVVSVYWWIDKVLKLYFSFKKNEKINKKHVLAFWGKITWLKKVTINTQAKLLKHSFIVQTKKDNSWLFISHCYFPYALGTYESNQWFITNVCKWASKSKNIAEKKAVSEAIERLSASMYVPCLWKQYQNEGWSLIIPYIDTKTFFKHKNIIFFDKIKSLLQKEDKLCPLDILYYPYLYSFPCISNSNGMATHLTYKQALKSALFELIERDSYVLMRLLKKWVYKLENSSLEGDIYKTISKIENDWFKLHIFIIKFDNPIPVSLIILEKDYKNIVVLWIEETLKSSIEKTIEEASSSIVFFGIKQNFEKDFCDYTIKEHINYYMEKWNASKLDRLKGLNPIKYRNCDLWFLKEANTKNIIEYYKTLNIWFYTYKYKNDINSAFWRYTVRVLSDQLLPIYFWKEIPLQILDSPRLKYFQNKFNVKNVNIDLHPMW